MSRNFDTTAFDFASYMRKIKAYLTPMVYFIVNGGHVLHVPSIQNEELQYVANMLHRSLLPSFKNYLLPVVSEEKIFEKVQSARRFDDDGCKVMPYIAHMAYGQVS